MEPKCGHNIVFYCIFDRKGLWIKVYISDKIYLHTELDPMTYSIFTLDHYWTSYIYDKLPNDHIFYLYGAIVEHDKV